MSRQDYQDILTNVSQPKMVENVVNAKMDKMWALFGKNTNVLPGSAISEFDRTVLTSAGGAFTRSDANPVSLTQTIVNPTWNKLYYAESAKVRREDIDEAAGTPLRNLLTDASDTATKLTMAAVFAGIIAQIKLDVDSAGTYSDAAITRVTSIQSYEESTNATITLSYLRGAQRALALKDEIDWSEYVWLLEQTVLNTAAPLMSATVTIQTPPSNGTTPTGYIPPSNFDTIPVDTTYGMTTGDCFLLNRDNVQIQIHKGLELEMVDVDEYAYKVVSRYGANSWVRRPAFQAKMTDKD